VFLVPENLGPAAGLRLHNAYTKSLISTFLLISRRLLLYMVGKIATAPVRTV